MSFSLPRCSKRVVRKPNANRAQRPCLERLEDRTLPSANPLSRVADLASLKVDPSSYDPSSILVRFHAGADAVRGSDILSGTDIGKGSKLVSGLHTVQLQKGVSVEAALRAYRASGLVEYADANYRVHIATIPNDPEFPSLYGLHNIGQSGGTSDADIEAPAAWDITTGSSSVVAVIDTGVDYTHPDLVNNMWTNPGEIADNGIDDDGDGIVDDIHGANFVGIGTPTGDPMDDNGHGTHVSGTIGAEGNNGIGVVGVAWDVQIMALKFLDSSGSGTIEDAIHAVEYATMMRTQYGVKVRIMSNSWGGGPSTQ